MLISATTEAASPIWRSTSHIDKGYPEPQLVEFVLGRNLLTLNNPGWKLRRKILAKCFHTEMIDGFQGAINQQSQTFVKNLKNEANSNKNDPSQPTFIKFREHVSALAVDIAGECLFGQDMKMQEYLAENSEHPEWAKHILHVLSSINDLVMNPLYWNPFIFKILNFKKHGALQESRSYVRNFLHDIIEKRAKNVADGIHNSFSKPCVIDQLVREVDDREQLFSELLLFFFASYDTSSAVMSDGLAYLARNESIQDKLITEIKEHCEYGEIYQETLNKMEYLDAVVNEMLRYCGPVSMQSREIKSPVKFGPNFELKASPDLPVTILILLRNINFDRAVWGDDARDFRPERFMEGNKMNVASFSHGPRACIG
jgi:cytochrome P450/NADPH-cytochrome P450 reductase